MAIGVVSVHEMEREKLRLGLVTKKEAEDAILGDLLLPEVVHKVEHRDIVRGRNGKKETPQLVRELVATEAISGAKNNELIQQFGLSGSSISAYKNGANSTATYNEPNKQIEKAIEEVQNRIRGIAEQKLESALNKIDFEEENLKSKDAATIAKDMSVIVKNMTPEKGIEINDNRVLVYRPRMKEEEDYEVQEVIDA